MKKIIVFLLLTAMMSGCGHDRPVVPEETMSAILYEMFLTDQYVEDNPDIKAASDSLNVYLPVLQEYGLSRDDFETALHYYLHNPDVLGRVVKDVRSRLEKRMHELDSVLQMPDAGAVAAVDTVKREHSVVEETW
ncbi:MAG: DUF4296 domain-containing protein [Bacteroidales bacterium]|nr:DUF4296 domain-containing protein [Candidatus Cacconaster merdequi]